MRPLFYGICMSCAYCHAHCPHFLKSAFIRTTQGFQFIKIFQIYAMIGRSSLWFIIFALILETYMSLSNHTKIHQEWVWQSQTQKRGSSQIFKKWKKNPWYISTFSCIESQVGYLKEQNLQEIQFSRFHAPLFSKNCTALKKPAQMALFSSNLDSFENYLILAER